MDKLTKIKEKVEVRNLDGFLGVVFDSQFSHSGVISDAEKMFDPLEHLLQKELTDDNFDKAYELLWTGFGKLIRYIGIESMKVAIDIENGNYVSYQ